jgi:hypothetical protein
MVWSVGLPKAKKKKIQLNKTNQTLKIKEKKNPFLAAVYSFIFSGLGRVYNGEAELGFTVFAGAAVSLGPSVRAFIFLIPGTKVGAFYFLISGLIVWILGIENAATVAIKMNKGKLPCKSTKNTDVFLFF